MTIKELFEKIHGFNDQERLTYLKPLFYMLTPVSNNEIVIFQNLWDTRKSYEEFKEVQANCIKSAIVMEISEVGSMARKYYGLEPLQWDTLIKEPDLHCEPGSNL